LRGDEVKIFRLAAILVAMGSLVASAGSSGQPAPGMHRIAYVNVGPAAANASNVAAFRDELRELGYIEGRNLIIDFRWGDGRVERLPGLIEELLALKPDLVFSTGGQPTILAVKAATSTLPVVFITGDPVAEGVVSSLSRPGGNLTGFAALAQDLEGKRLELLRELLPAARRVALIWNPSTPSSVKAKLGAQAAALRLGMSVQWFEARNPGELPPILASIPVQSVDAMMLLADPVLGFERATVLTFAAQHRLPAMYFWREFVEEGGLMSYGASLTTVYRRAAHYADKVYHGAKPADLPIEQPTTFELAINLNTAKALGLTVPQSLLLRADEVIR
jgi:putative tryptophan/tyrosine transport system substrate-binding protein